MTTKPIVNLADVELRKSMEHGAKYGATIGAIGPVVGAKKLGYNLTVLPAGKRAFPKHNHHVNEEMFFVVEGEGEVHIGPDTYPIRTGDVIACPPGPAELAHQIVNTSGKELRYLAVSTKLSPEFVEYPDSKKFGFAAEVAGPGGAPRLVRFLGREGGSLDYWDGE